MGWQDTLRERYAAAIGRLGLGPTRTAELVESELKQAVADTEAGRALGAPVAPAPEAEELPMFATSEEDYAIRRLALLRAERKAGKGNHWV